MKRFLLFFIVLLIPAMIFSQSKCSPEGFTFNESKVKVTPKVVMPDFTITTTDGVTRNLYAVLGAGKTVMLDQFFTTCGTCQAYAPVIDQAYVNTGSGTGNILFWGIDYDDSNAEVIAYMSTYGVSNPCASGTQGGGNNADALIQSIYPGFYGYPTYSVVCPNHTISLDVNFPPTAGGFASYFQACGASSVGQIDELRFDDIYPIPASENVYFEFTLNEPSKVTVVIYNLMGQEMISYSERYDAGVYNLNFPVSDFAIGTYIVKLIKDSKLAEINRFIVAR